MCSWLHPSVFVCFFFFLLWLFFEFWLFYVHIYSHEMLTMSRDICRCMRKYFFKPGCRFLYNSAICTRHCISCPVCKSEMHSACIYYRIEAIKGSSRSSARGHRSQYWTQSPLCLGSNFLSWSAIEGCVPHTSPLWNVLYNAVLPYYFF